MPTDGEILQWLRGVKPMLPGDVSLATLAARAGWSPFHFHRALRRVTAETPKRYIQRLRLEAAAARLVTSRESIARIAVGAGFGSHEVFTRAFRRHFGRTPAAYRADALQGAPPGLRVRHAAVTASAGPCVGLFHLSTTRRKVMMPTLSIERRALDAQPILFVRTKAARHELPKAIAQGVGKVYMHAQTSGAPLDGHPFTRYLSSGPGLLDIEVGFRVARDAAGAGDVISGELPAGETAVAVHAGPYDQLAETYAAVERWIEQNGLRPVGAPWEWYVTDPADHPDPADWRTEVYWPVTR
jgi:AraC family transcriptional regulator